MIVIGIDPGFTGAIAVLDKEGKVKHLIDMPVIAVGKKTELDAVAIRNLFFEQKGDPLLFVESEFHVYIEKAQAFMGSGKPCPLCKKKQAQGVVSTANYMASYGIIKGICVGLNIPYTLVHPKTWKAKMMRDMSKEKGASIVRVRQLYPELDFPRKKDHGRADAILIARYGLNKMGVENETTRKS
jgi:crossover junction endodeoxyribonuclease RuvC